MRKYDRGDLNSDFRPKTGFSLEPDRFNVHHFQYKLIEQFIKSGNNLVNLDHFKGIVLRVENQISVNSFDSERSVILQKKNWQK